MNLEGARKLAREAYIISIDLAEDEDTVEGMRRTILELADEVERREAVVQAARGMCQWLDYHADDVATWGPDARDWADELHTSVIALEEEHHS